MFSPIIYFAAARKREATTPGTPICRPLQALLRGHQEVIIHQQATYPDQFTAESLASPWWASYDQTNMCRSAVSLWLAYQISDISYLGHHRRG